MLKQPVIKTNSDFNYIVSKYAGILNRYACWLIPQKAAAGRIVRQTLYSLVEQKNSLYAEQDIREFLKNTFVSNAWIGGTKRH